MFLKLKRKRRRAYLIAKQSRDLTNRLDRFDYAHEYGMPEATGLLAGCWIIAALGMILVLTF